MKLKLSNCLIFFGRQQILFMEVVFMHVFSFISPSVQSLDLTFRGDLMACAT